MILDKSVDLLMAFIREQKDWIIEGCYSDIIAQALPHCEKLIFLNPGINICVQHCRMRPWEPEKFESSEQQDAHLHNLIHWVKEYETRDDEYGLKRHRQLFDSFKGTKREFNQVSEYKKSNKRVEITGNFEL